MNLHSYTMPHSIQFLGNSDVSISTQLTSTKTIRALYRLSRIQNALLVYYIHKCYLAIVISLIEYSVFTFLLSVIMPMMLYFLHLYSALCLYFNKVLPFRSILLVFCRSFAVTT